jgi:hypothetical protein
MMNVLMLVAAFAIWQYMSQPQAAAQAPQAQAPQAAAQVSQVSVVNNFPPLTIYMGRGKLGGGLGASMYPDVVPITHSGYMPGGLVAVAWDGMYTRMLGADNVSRYMVGDYTTLFDANHWNTYLLAGVQFTIIP